MKYVITLILTLTLICACAYATAEETENRLDIAFGLFSVTLPDGDTAGPNTGNVLSDFRFVTDGNLRLIYANYATMDEYESTARRKLDSLVSMVFALSGSDMSHYSETEIAEEELENGIRLRWQLMRGDALHALWFEAFDDLFGYNMCIQCNADAADDEAMLAVMRSFRADPKQERDLLEVRQTQLAGGAFISVERGLQIQLNEDWEIVPYKEYLQPGTAFMLVLNEGEQMVQLFSDHPVDAGDARALLDWFLQAKGGSSAGEPYAVTLDGLGGIESWVAEETSGVSMYNVAFVHEGYGYYGMLMWVPQDDAEARPFMMEALRTLSVPKNLEYYRSGDFTVVVDGDTLEITDYLGTDTAVVIPMEIDGHPVTYIWPKAFDANQEIVTVDIRARLTNLSGNFCICQKLETVILPDSLRVIGDEAFMGCHSLKEITIPESVTTIGLEAFANCDALETIRLPESVTVIDEFAFSTCTSLTSINIPAGVTTIGDNAFELCSNLTSISIPAGVTSIGRDAFSMCDNLVITVVPGSYAETYCKDHWLTYVTADE